MSNPFNVPSIQPVIMKKHNSFIKKHVIFFHLQTYIIFERQNRKVLFPRLNTNSDTENMTRVDQSSEEHIREFQLQIFYGKRQGVLNVFLKEVYKSKTNAVIQHKSIKLIRLLHLSIWHLAICQLKPEALDTSKILYSR